MILAIGSTLVGVLVGFFLALYVEKKKHPILQLSIGDRVQIPQPQGTVLRLDLVNKPLPKFLQYFLVRSPAFSCKGIISFHKLDGQLFFAQKMPIRFSDSREPIPLRLYRIEDIANNQQNPWGVIIDKYLYSRPSTIDVIAGEVVQIDIVYRAPNETICYGWTNSSYQFPDYRNTDWRLPQGTYIIQVIITSFGHHICRGVFRLVNEGENIRDFRLLPSQPEDNAFIKQYTLFNDFEPY